MGVFVCVLLTTPFLAGVGLFQDSRIHSGTHKVIKLTHLSSADQPATTGIDSSAFA